MKKDRFLDIQNKYTFIYAVVTMLSALISGFLFNIYPYIPMIGGLIFCVINLFIQYKLNSFLTLGNVSIILTVIVSASRITRVLANYFFIKIYEKYKSKILSIIGYSLLISFTLILIGNLIAFKIFGIILMSIGFCLFLAIRDQFDNFIKELLLDIAYQTGPITEEEWPKLRDGIRKRNLSKVYHNVNREDASTSRNKWAKERVKAIPAENGWHW